MMIELTGLLLNEKGLERDAAGLSTDGDEYGLITAIMVNTDAIDSVIQLLPLTMGRKVCKVFLRSGDAFTVFESYEQIKHILTQQQLRLN